jgi:hypothetical protein
MALDGGDAHRYSYLSAAKEHRVQDRSSAEPTFRLPWLSFPARVRRKTGSGPFAQAGQGMLPYERIMKVLMLFMLWCVLLVLCWPLALLALVLLPIVWLISIPFRILFFAVEALLAIVRTLFLLPARLVGYRPNH